jgi:hypothetical protein
MISGQGDEEDGVQKILVISTQMGKENGLILQLKQTFTECEIKTVCRRNLHDECEIGRNPS